MTGPAREGGAGEADDLPTVTHSGEVDIAGYRLVAHVLSDGTRVYEDTPELRRMLADMTGHAGAHEWTFDSDIPIRIVPLDASAGEEAGK